MKITDAPVLVDSNGIPEKTTVVESGASYLTGKPLLVLNKDKKDDVHKWFLYYPLSTESDKQTPWTIRVQSHSAVQITDLQYQAIQIKELKLLVLDLAIADITASKCIDKRDWMIECEGHQCVIKGVKYKHFLTIYQVHKEMPIKERF